MRLFDQPMSPDERLQAVAAILAAGILRLHARAALPTDLAPKNLPESGQTHLEVPRETGLTVIHGG